VPLFSIVTVVRNDVAGLLKTHDSIACQGFSDLEWLIVDGASSDGTVATARRFVEAYVSLTSEPDAGIYDAMNRGLDRAMGDYVLFLNAGDTFARPDTLQTVADRLEVRRVDLLYGDSYEAFDGRVLSYKTARGHGRVRYGMFACHQAMYYRRAWVGHQRFDPRLRIAGDYGFTARLLCNHGSVERVDAALCVFDRTGVSLAQRRRGRRENWCVQRDVLGLTWMRRCTIRTAYVASALLSSSFPDLYKALRFRKEYAIQHAD
jgi:putative colanic acid biosynthesis glycosyltransferase